MWHFCSRKSAYKLEKVNKRALRVVENDYSASYSELLELAGCSTLYIDRIRSIAVETFKYRSKINPQFFESTYVLLDHPHDTRGGENFKIPKVSTEKHGTNSLGFESVKIWNSLPSDIKLSASIDDFKFTIKHWEGPSCSCGYCLLCSINRL